MKYKKRKTPLIFDKDAHELNCLRTESPLSSRVFSKCTILILDEETHVEFFESQEFEHCYAEGKITIDGKVEYATGEGPTKETAAADLSRKTINKAKGPPILNQKRLSARQFVKPE